MKNLISQKDLTWFILIAIAILTFSSIPFFIGKATETPEFRFKGTYFDTEDYAVHLSMMQAGRLGDWAYKLRFTDEEHSSAYIRLFYIVLGHVSSWIGLNVENTYHLARWIFGFIALYFIYKVCQRILPAQNQARTAFLLAVFGSGVGWIMLFLGVPLEPISPIDFWLIDAYVFFSISLFPSFSFSLALIALALNLLFDYLNTGKKSLILWVSFFAVLSQTTNPISFAVVDLTFAGTIFFMWWEKHKIEMAHIHALVWLAIAQLPLLIYNFLILSHAPVWNQFTTQNQTLSPPFVFYLLGFAPFLLLVPYAVYLAIRESNINFLALSLWVFASISLAYLPVAIQRRFLLGITLPLAILATYGLRHLIQKIPFLLSRENLIYFTYILFSSISSIYLILGLSLFLKTLPPERFYPRELDDAMTWLNENAPPNEFVLADIATSQLIAQKTGLKVYIGHEMETINFKDKKAEMLAFYQGNQPIYWLTNTQVRWVIYGPYERKNSPFFVVPLTLKLMYNKKGVKIYKFNSQ